MNELEIEKIEGIPVEGKLYWRKIYSDGSYSRLYRTDLDYDMGAESARDRTSFLIEMERTWIGKFEKPDAEEETTRPSQLIVDTEQDGNKKLVQFFLGRLDCLLALKNKYEIDRWLNSERVRLIDRSIFSIFIDLRALGAEGEAKKRFDEHGIPMNKPIL